MLLCVKGRSLKWSVTSQMSAPPPVRAYVQGRSLKRLVTAQISALIPPCVQGRSLKWLVTAQM